MLERSSNFNQICFSQALIVGFVPPYPDSDYDVPANNMGSKIEIFQHDAAFKCVYTLYSKWPLG